MPGRTRAILFRVALGLSALSLWAYIPYRYATRPPRLDGPLGTAYALLFPVAALLALAVLAGAWRPRLVDGLAGRRVSRAALGGYALTWLAMGLMCVPRLQAVAAGSPLKGAVSTIHMTAQHVFLGLTAAGAAWRPRVVASILLARPVESDATSATRRLEESASG